MLRFLVPLSLSLLLPFAAEARCAGDNLIDALSPADRAELEAATAAHPYSEGNIWRAEKDGSTVHVVGTIHIHDPRLLPIRDTVRPILEEANLLILEATTEDQMGLQQKIVANPEIAFITQGPSLIDLLGDEVWSDLLPQLEARGVPGMIAAQYRPWLVSVTLAIPPCALADQQAGLTGLDAMLEGIAEERAIPIETLDNVDDILDLITAGTLEEQIEMLKVALEMDINGEAVMSTTLDSYFAGRHAEFLEFSRLLSRQLTGSDEAVDEFLKVLLEDRNLGWADQLPELLNGKDVVIAVGSAHLSGETGVLTTLEQMGYELTQQ